MGKPIPLTPSTQVKGGGQFDFPYDDVVLEITDIKTVKRDFTNKDGVVVAKDVPALAVTYMPESGGDAAVFEYSAGDAKRVKPSDDGEMFESADEEKEFEGLTDTCRAGFFFKKMVEAGFPESKFSPSVRFAIGTKGHVRQVPGPKTGNAKTDEKKIPVFTKISVVPGGATTDASKVAETAEKFIAKVLEKKETVTTVELGQFANKNLVEKAADAGAKKTALEVVKLLLDQKFLKSEKGWKYTGQGITRKAEAAASEDISL